VEVEMIIRAWRGWTDTADAASAYQELLNGTIAPDIMRRRIAGLRELAVLRRVEQGGDAEYLTLMTFDDWAAVTEFAGPEPSGSVVPAAARALLTRHDEHSQHYELLQRHLPST
jgi:hypothetical protein